MRLFLTNIRFLKSFPIDMIMPISRCVKGREGKITWIYSHSAGRLLLNNTSTLHRGKYYSSAVAKKTIAW